MISDARAKAIFREERRRFVRAGYAVGGTALELVNLRCLERGCKDRDVAMCQKDSSGESRVLLLRRALTTVGRVRGLVRHELGHLALDFRGSEQDADDMAESVTGRKIRYDAQNIQTTGAGTWPRPKRLPR